MELVIAEDISYLETTAAINAANIVNGGLVILRFGGWHVVHGAVVDVSGDGREELESVNG